MHRALVMLPRLRKEEEEKIQELVGGRYLGYYIQQILLDYPLIGRVSYVSLPPLPTVRYTNTFPFKHIPTL